MDLYKKIGKEKNRKVLGLAWVNGMCRPSYSCTLNEGKNFESAFVIAHEMAHRYGFLPFFKPKDLTILYDFCLA